jgi:hypothetical protein
MPARPTNCPKCNGSMMEGWMLDHTHGAKLVSGWVAGKPEMGMWSGVKLKGQKPLQIATWRCAACGFLESYAR